MPTSQHTTRRSRTTVTETTWSPHRSRRRTRQQQPRSVTLDTLGSTWQVTRIHLEDGRLVVTLSGASGSIEVYR